MPGPLSFLSACPLFGSGRTGGFFCACGNPSELNYPALGLETFTIYACASMPRTAIFSFAETLTSPRHEALVAAIIEERKAAGLTQEALARRLGRYQSFVAKIEQGQRRVSVVEFLALAEAIGFDPCAVVSRVLGAPRK